MTQQPYSIQRGYVVSDLHIFGCSSLYERNLSRLYAACAQYRTVILNGDTFDFKRSVYHSAQETSEHARAWLASACHNFPSTTFHFILGNHDSHESFTPLLHELARSQSNLLVSEELLRCGPSLFVHGDAIDLPIGSFDVLDVRRGYMNTEPSIYSKIFATAVTRLRLNVVEYIRHSRKELAEKLLNYLETRHGDTLQGVKSIYFGHTHVPFTNFEHRGFNFNNTGSLIRGLPWMPLECELS